MPQDALVGSDSGSKSAGMRPRIEPSILNAIPHYLPLGIYPLIVLAAFYGGWWLLPPLLFMSVAGPLDKALGVDGRNMDPVKTPERRLIWHNLPVWTWAFLWPPTLIFGMWQILAVNQFAVWEAALLVIILTMEGQAVFVVGHELIHRRTTWERRIGEFLLASALVSSIRHGARLHPSCLGGHTARRGVRSERREFLAVLSQGGRVQPYEFLEGSQ